MDTTSTATVTTAQPWSAEQIEQYKADFYRDGFRYIPNPGVVTPAEIERMKAGIDRVFAEPEKYTASNHIGPSGYALVRLFEIDPIFEEMIDREPYISLVESILGEDCHLISENALRNSAGTPPANWYHVDGPVILPLPERVNRHDARLPMPVFMMTVFIALTDIPSMEYGPSQYIPGSHYSGREPDEQERPHFEDREPVSMFCKAGDVYLHNGQCWHTGTPNRSDRMRYVFQLSYGMRWVSQRFYPFVNYQFPPGIVERANERRRRLLGFHGWGAYG